MGSSRTCMHASEQVHVLDGEFVTASLSCIEQSSVRRFVSPSGVRYRTAALNYWQHMVSPSTVAWHHRFPQFVAKCPRTHTTPCSLLAASIQSTSARAPRRAPHEIIFPLQASNCRQFKRHACPFCWLVGADINHPWTLKLLSILFHVACHSDVPQTPHCPDLNIGARCE